MAALDGIRVLDFTQVIFGPAGTQVLADHGADVIKVERPGIGDLARSFGQSLQGESLAYMSLNRGKRSLAVNLKMPEGMAIIHRLLATTDVLVHNFRPGVMARLGLDYPTLASHYPRLIYAEGSGYGTRGPYAERHKGGHESLAQALSGAAAKYQGPDGMPRRWPMAIADFTGGMLLAQVILLALLARERTGRGQAVETSLLDGLMAMQAWETSSLLNRDHPAAEGAPRASDDGAAGASRPGGNPLDGGVYRTRDGYLMVTALFRPYPQPLRALCAAVGIEDLSTDPRFASLQSLSANRDALRAKLEPVFATRTSAEWVPKLEAHDVLCAPIRSTAEALQDPQLAVNGLIVEVAHPRLGSLRHVGTPLRLADTPAGPGRAAPMLGEHSDQVLDELGYSAAEIAHLRARGVVESASAGVPAKGGSPSSVGL